MQAVHPPACFFPISPRSRTRALAVPQQAKGDTASTGNGNGKTRLVIKGTVTPSRAAPFFQPSGEQTPNISEAAEKIRRSLSVASLHDLAHMKPKELRKQIASKVWRAQDEQVRIPTDWERLAVHVVRGTIRAGNLAFSLRATMTLVLGLIKALRTHKFQGQTLVRSMFGLDAWRFAGMFGHWAALYKATHNSLRLLTPFPTKRPRSLSQKNIAHDTPGTSSSTALSASSTDVLSTLDARSISNSRSTPFFDVRADRHNKQEAPVKCGHLRTGRLADWPTRVPRVTTSSSPLLRPRTHARQGPVDGQTDNDALLWLLSVRAGLTCDFAENAFLYNHTEALDQKGRDGRIS
ncbi:unnamed protein product [Tilletia caries]|uniref:Uncharacterized protein n=1 Tax=Tilletia caries TaxID=13290 RepID=A0ABN7IVK3_9BASI|nr:unnamed protein product [Tilletia caries]